MISKTCCYCFLILTTAWLAKPARASNLYLLPGGNNDVNFSSPYPYDAAATASEVLTSSQTYGAATYSTSLSFGEVDLSTSYNDIYASGQMTLGAVAADYLFFSGASIASGALAVNFSVTGTVSSASGYDTGMEVAYALGGGPDLQAIGGSGSYFALNSQNGNWYNGAPVDGNLDDVDFTFTQDATGAWDFQASGTAMVNIFNNEADLSNALYFYQVCQGYPCDYTASVNATVSSNVAIYDSNGNLLQGVTINSEAGVDYTQNLPGSSTPEPTTFWMISAGLAALAIRARKRVA